MTTETRNLETAMEEAANRQSNTPSGSAQAVALPVAPSPTLSPIPILSDVALAQLQERGVVAQQVLHLMSIPILTPERVQELEASLPAILETIRSIRFKPSIQAEILPMIEAIKQQGLAGIQTPEDEARLKALAELIQNDVWVEGEGERFLQFVAPVALGVASFMGGYVIAHNWGR